MIDLWKLAGLWAAVVASGLYHGLNPAMGWPLAASNGLMARSQSAILPALGYLGFGHALAALAVMLPFGMLSALLAWQTQIRLAAGVLLIGYGIALLPRHRHARVIARIRPSRLALWSFAVATAHGAGLMLVPLYLGLCSPDADATHQAAAQLTSRNLGMAVWVSVVHTTVMVAAGGAMAWLACRHLGPKLVSQSWFNTDIVWASSLILVGVLSLALTAMH